MITPAKSPAEKRQICTCTGRCKGPQGLGPGWVCAMEGQALKDARAIHDFVASGTPEDLVRIVNPVELHHAKLALGL